MGTAHAICLWREQQGISSIEYSLIAALIAVLCTAAITALGGRTLDLYLLVCNGVASATGNPPC
jgi:Flp pilus assembly pilin Flp